MVKVSIIVPVHNSEAYLHKCVDSLLGQTLADIEIILVDDCSTDNSRDLITAYAEKYPGKVVPLYLPENLRQGGARNRGMELARGEYIGFVDSDDFVDPDLCKVLYDAAEGADLCGADYWIDTGNSLRRVHLDFGHGPFDQVRKIYFVTHGGLFVSRIYRREFLQRNQLQFPEGIFYEDAWFNFMTALYATSVIKAEGSFYHYFQSVCSTTRFNDNPHQYERIAIPSMILRDCKARNIYDQNKKLIDYKYISMQMSNILYTCLGQFKKPSLTQLERIRTAVKAECPHYRKIPYYKEAPFQLRFYFRLTMLWPRLAVLAYKANRFVELLAVLDSKIKRRK